MRKIYWTALPMISLSASVPATDWFEHNTPLTQAHQHLLEDDLAGTYQSLVEVWQTAPNEQTVPHLNRLLGHALTRDCGKGLSNTQLPEWISALKITRQTIQSPGRVTYRALVDITTKNQLDTLSLNRWIDKSVSSDSNLSQVRRDVVTRGLPSENDYQKIYNLSNKLEAGLYRLTVTSTAGNAWSTWILLGEYQAPQYVRWSSKSSWKVEKTNLIDPLCPLPEMVVGVFDYQDGQYKQIWQDSYEANYPTELEIGNQINPGRYVLAVSMNTRRWQGEVVIERAQTISRNYEITQPE